MQLRLRTKLTLVMTGLVFLVVVTLSGVYFARLTSQVSASAGTTPTRKIALGAR